MLKIFFSFFFALCMLFTCIFTAVKWTAFDKNFYLEQYKKNNTYEAIGISEEELSHVTDSIIAYLGLDSDELNLSVQISGQTRNFFNDKELSHMVDVRELFRFINSFNIFCYVGIAISFAFLIRENGGLILAKTTAAVFIGFVIIAALLAALISSNFNYYFTVFHEIFFSNALWILDPKVDLLINIVPLPFFMSIASYTAVVFALFSAITIVICFGGLWLKGGFNDPSSNPASDN